MLASNLFRISKKLHGERDTQSLLDELSELEDENASHYSFSSNVRASTTSRTSTPCSSRSSSSRKRSAPETLNDVSDKFKLPIFSPDLKKCINKDGFYTRAQRNKLIKEACMAYCWERDKPVSSSEKRSLAISLLNLAPKSLGDPPSQIESSPEVRLYIYSIL